MTKLTDKQKAEATIEFMEVFKGMIHQANMFGEDRRTFIGTLLEIIEKRKQNAEKYIAENQKTEIQ